MEQYSKELGIDEAGRGPVLGPLVLAGVVVPADKLALLKTWGVSDSKAYGSSLASKIKRADLSAKICCHFQHEIITLPSQVVDQYVQTGGLNRLEQETARLIIDRLVADTVVLDGKHLFAPLESDSIKAFDRADTRFLSVSAASILAKVERDRQFAQLCSPFSDSYGAIKGGGYANGKTLDFVQWHLEMYGTLPAFYRASYCWKALIDR